MNEESNIENWVIIDSVYKSQFQNYKAAFFRASSYIATRTLLVAGT